MTIDPRKPGDKKIPARDWNALASAYNSGMLGGAIRSGSESNNPVKVLVKNNTGGDLGRRAIVGLGDSVISLADNEVQWKNEIVLNGETPETGTHDTKYAVLLESIADGGIGEAVICGVTQVLLNVVASGDTHAAIEDGETDYLTTSGSGTAEIIWKESGTGSKLGIVRLCSQASGVRLGKTDEAITKGSIGTVSEYVGAEGTEVDNTLNVECKNRFADVDTGKWVAFVKIGGFHYLIAAEC